MSTTYQNVRHCRHVLAWVALAIFAWAGQPWAAAGERRITVADVIGMTRLADEGYFRGGPPDRPVGLFSPDRCHFVVVVRKGNIARNTNEYSLLLFGTAEVRQHPAPKVLLTMSSSSNRYGIRDVRWLTDNRTLVFLGEKPGKTPAIYSIDIKTNRLRALARHRTSIVAYDISANGQTIIFEAAPEPKKFLNSEETRRHGIVVSDQYLSQLLTNDYALESTTIGSLELFVQSGRKSATAVNPHSYLYRTLPLWMSPDGRYAVLIAQPSNIPEHWLEYSEPLLHSYIVGRKQGDRLSPVQQYLLVDVRRRTVVPLLDAPLGWHNRGLVWSPDGNSVAVSGTYLPLMGRDPALRKTRQAHGFVAEVHLPDRRLVEISQAELCVSAWHHATGALVLVPESPTPQALQTIYVKKGGVWQARATTDEPKPHDAVEVTLEEDLNTPPKIFVRTSAEQPQRLLFDLNPQLAEFRLGKVEAVTWKASDGHEVRGGLYLPPDYRPGQRYPLVIQTHGFDPHRFWVDGPWTSAFAAQPLAARGMVVLQVGAAVNSGEDGKYANTPEEAPRQMAAFEGAIDYLDDRGLIDRTKVGIIGFSRTVYHVEYTLTHSRYPFAAAEIADGFDGGYVGYLLWGVVDFAAVNGGPPLGKTLLSWAERSPGFRLEQVTAPVRMEYYGFAGVLNAWQWYAGLSQLHKPVEFIWLPDGIHMLLKPWDRLLSQQGTVDWFTFWFKGELDPDPEKSEQYRRWVQLRRLHDAEQSESRERTSP